jgi:hypothetical protein
VSLRNRRLLDWSVMKGLLDCLVGDEGPPVAVVQMCAAADDCCGSLFSCWLLLKV